MRVAATHVAHQPHSIHPAVFWLLALALSDLSPPLPGLQDQQARFHGAGWASNLVSPLCLLLVPSHHRR